MSRFTSFSAAAFAACCLLSCSDKASSAARGTLPTVTPPVRAAAPAGFQARALDDAELSSRFFTTGPTSIFNLLTAIDDRINDVNDRTGTAVHECLTQTPVAYNITAFGEVVPMFAQCYEMVGGTELVQWGMKDDVFYLYAGVGASHVAVKATPIVGTDKYTVDAWIGVGYTNIDCPSAGTGSWDTCSYGVIRLTANSQTLAFEMTVAGIGFGYCGAQLKSDGTNVYAEGSADMGATCDTADSLCVLAANTGMAGSCGGAVGTFALTSLGRTASTGSGNAITPNWGASDFPAVPNVTLDGTNTDALYFGPTTATVGVGLF